MSPVLAMAYFQSKKLNEWKIHSSKHRARPWTFWTPMVDIGLIRIQTWNGPEKSRISQLVVWHTILPWSNDGESLPIRVEDQTNLQICSETMNSGRYFLLWCKKKTCFLIACCPEKDFFVRFMGIGFVWIQSRVAWWWIPEWCNGR